MSKIFGLDFGTSNSSLSLNNNHSIRLIDIDPFSPTATTLKSVLYFDEEEREFLIGQRAIDMYIENDAHGRYVQSIKSFLPSKTPVRTVIGGKTFDLDQLIAIIIRQIKDSAENKIGAEVNDVVLGRPVIFSEDKEIDKEAESRLISAAKIAGFKNIHLQFEPIAAALSYESTLSQGEEKLVLVGDFGGGTSDFTIIKLYGGHKTTPRKRNNDILANGGVYIGGNDFDSQIMWEKITPYYGRGLKLHSMTSKMTGGKASDPFPQTILKQLCQWHSIPSLRTPKKLEYFKELKYLSDNNAAVDNIINLVEDNYGYMLFREIEKAKCHLSKYEQTQILFKSYDLLINERISQSNFAIMIDEKVSSIKKSVHSVLKKACLKSSNIDTVFLTGGSSYIPSIRDYFVKEFGAASLSQTNVFTSVAHGLSYHGDRFI
ncbi:Hsp70 family protein [Desulfobulbus sp. N2]|nr:Hsp70 family protein [Desulfobulbus sp. N2]MCW5214043.1 Hsp70 family protein [Desulfobulbus sp. US5]